jgi:shikimate dehydrogenase
MELYGLVGEILGHSLSPLIHRCILAELNVSGTYQLMEIPRDRIVGLGAAMKTLGIRGVNVTIPYKRTVMDQLDVLSPQARTIGAVNTITLRDGKLMGDNTDYHGFLAMLRQRGIAILGRRFTVLGTGGASRAVTAAIRDGGGIVTLVSRRPQEGAVTYDALGDHKGDVLVNCTPVGMYPHSDACPVEPWVIERHDDIVDLIYNPLETKLLVLGRMLGKRTCGGLSMLVSQAVRAQELWQEGTIPPEVEKAAYEAARAALMEGRSQA